MSAIRNFCWPKGKREQEARQTLRCLNTARLIMDLKCVTTTEGRPMYQRFGNHWKVCEKCYLAMTIELQKEHVAVAPHLLIHMNFLYNQEKCASCRKEMVRYKEAEECEDCLDAFEHADKVRLRLGWGYPCIKPKKYLKSGQINRSVGAVRC
jgi:hypothetical protein